MSHRYRLYPTPGLQGGLERHCADARFVWNLALDQHNFGRERRDGKWRDKPGLGPRPGSAARQRQLAEARQGTWLADGSSSVRQQALRDFDQALANWSGKTHGRPRWRKKGEDAGFCVRDVTVNQLNRRWATVAVPKVGKVRFRLSRPLPAAYGMARITLDAAGRWHVSFAAAQAAVVRTTTGLVVGIDRGVATALALSNGTMLQAPSSPKLAAKVALFDQRLARQRRGSKHRAQTKQARARSHARTADRRRDWVEKTTTRLVVDHDVLVLQRPPGEEHGSPSRTQARSGATGGVPPQRGSCQGGAQPVDSSVEPVHLRPTAPGQGGGEWLHRRSCRSSIHLPAVPSMWPYRTGEQRETSGLPVRQMWPRQPRRHQRCGEHRGRGLAPAPTPGHGARPGDRSARVSPPRAAAGTIREVAA